MCRDSRLIVFGKCQCNVFNMIRLLYLPSNPSVAFPMFEAVTMPVLPSSPSTRGPNLMLQTTTTQASIISHSFYITMQPLLFITTFILSAAALSSAAVLHRPHELRSLPRNQTLPALDHRQLSHVPIGAIINHCTIPGTVALTFDDGPYIYTAQILDTLAAHGAVATFFLNGVNKGSIAAFPDLVRRTLGEGHQLGSHAYAHPHSTHHNLPTSPHRKQNLTSTRQL